MRVRHMIAGGLATALLLSLGQGPAEAQQEGGYAEEGGGQAGGPPPGPPPPDPRAVRALRLRFEREPTVKEVQQASLRFFKVNSSRLDSYRRGANWKGLMPNLELIFNHEYGTNDRTLFDWTYRTKYCGMPGAGAECWPAKDTEGVKRASISLGVRANWGLDRLIFNPEVLDVASLVGVQEGLLREITSLYFTRRRLMTSAVLNPPQSPQEQITEQLRLDEITANLDSLTGGYLSREIKKRLGEG